MSRSIGAGVSTLLIVLAGALIAASGAVASEADPQEARNSAVVPGTQLSGAGAFMGPVRRARVGDIAMGYRQFGRGPDLLMIAGDTAPMSLWMPYLLEPLSRHFRVTIFDNRGVGYSTDNTSVPMTVPLMARDTERLIRVLGLDRPTVLGWSMGGEIALTMAVRQVADLNRIVTVGGDAGSRRTLTPPPGILRALADPDAGPGLLLEALFPQTRAGLPAERRFIRGLMEIPQEPVSPTTLDRQLHAETAFLRDPRVWRRLGRISVPVLLTNGRLDRLVPFRNAYRLDRRIPRSHVSIYPGAGHGMAFQDARRFARQIVRFGR